MIFNVYTMLLNMVNISFVNDAAQERDRTTIAQQRMPECGGCVVQLLGLTAVYSSNGLCLTSAQCRAYVCIIIHHTHAWI